MDASAIEEADARVRATVEGILGKVKAQGDTAIRELSKQFDNWEPKDFRLSPADIEKAISQVAKRDIDDIPGLGDLTTADAQNCGRGERDETPARGGAEERAVVGSSPTLVGADEFAFGQDDENFVVKVGKSVEEGRDRCALTRAPAALAIVAEISG